MTEKNTNDHIADDRKKVRIELMKILSTPIHPRIDVDPMEALADYLLDSGITIRKDSEWVGIPVSGVWRVRCGNLDCARLLPFGLDQENTHYCPHCGARMR